MDKASLDVISCDSVPFVADASTERNDREDEDNVNRIGGGQIGESAVCSAVDNGTVDGDASTERNSGDYEDEVKRSAGGQIDESAVEDAVDTCIIDGDSCRMVNEEDTSSSDESEDDSTSESESESSNSSSSSSSDDDDQREVESDEKNNRGATIQEVGANGNGIGLDGGIDVEEGEIMGTDEMVAWSGDEEDADAEEGEIMGIDEMASWIGDEDDGDGDIDGDGGVAPAGPIRSKNELEVLPPVPPVKDSLQPHHQTVPVGAVLSILGTQVIVEGAEKHNPLDEGSILWISQTREPLGIVDEVFGPVKNPFYIIRYNSESEVPTGIEPGTSACYVPEFANHVLENKSVHEKGYDASGAHDEEILDDQEFTDDEKEAEYKKTQKLKKRGSSNTNLGSKKIPERKFKNRPGNKKFDNAHSQQVPSGQANRPAGYSVQTVPPIPAVVDTANAPYSCSPVQGLAVQPGVTAPFAQLRLNSAGAYGMPPSNMGFNGLQQSTMPFLQHPHMTMLNGLPIQHQIGPNACLPSNLAFHMGMSGFNAAPAFAPIPGGLMGNTINPAYFQMGNPGQQLHFPAGLGGQAFAGNMQPSNGISGKPRPNFDQRNVENSEPHQRGTGNGDGHFGGFRG